MIRTLIFFSLLFVFISGCAKDIVQRYHPSPDLAIDLENSFLQNGKKVRIASVNGCSKLNALCRLYREIEPPQKDGFCDYIKNAFNAELKRAKLYSSNPDIEINLEFKVIRFDSKPDYSYWKYSVQISSGKSEPFTISSTYRFYTSYIPFKEACEQVSYSFSGSVEQLLKDITNAPQFSALF